MSSAPRAVGGAVALLWIACLAPAWLSAAMGQTHPADRLDNGCDCPGHWPRRGHRLVERTLQLIKRGAFRLSRREQLA